MKQMRRIHLGQVIGLGFGLILFLTLLIALLGRIAYDISRTQNNTIQTRGDVAQLTLQLEIISVQRTESLRRYLENEDVNLLATYQTRQLAYSDTYSRLAPLLNTPSEKQTLQNVVSAETAFNEKAQEMLKLFNDGFPTAARFLWAGEGIDTQRHLLASIDDLRQI